MKKRSVQMDEKGQSLVEFALTLILVMAFLMFFTQLGLIFGFGNYVQYATYMSARAYQSAGPSPDEQRERAKEVIKMMLKKRGQALDRFPSLGQGTGGGDPSGMTFNHPQYDPSKGAYSWLLGVRYTFKSRLFMLPLAGRTERNSVNSVTLTSETYLGREPTYSECAAQLQSLGGIFDNGC